MCSREESNTPCAEHSAPPTPASQKIQKGGNICGKCKVKAAQVATQQEPRCRECFVDEVEHTVRRAVSKPPIISNDDVVAVAFSGGPASAALLDILMGTLSPTAPRRRFFRVCVVIIDESVTAGDDPAVLGAWREATALAQAKAAQYGVPAAVGRLEDVFADPADTGVAEQCRTAAEGLLASCRTLTAREDVLHNLRTNAILNCAAQAGCTKVAMGTSGSQAAIRMLAETCKGRGASVPASLCRSAFSPRYSPGMRVVQPLKDVIAKDIAMYNHFVGTTFVVVPNMYTRSDRTSIGKLVGDFVTTLQAGFPSTVHTILRTSEKLHVSDPMTALDDSIKENKARAAAAKPGGSTAEDVDPSHYCVVCAGHLGESDGEQLWEHLFSREALAGRPEWARTRVCYGCRNIVNEMADVTALPESFHQFFKTLPASGEDRTGRGKEQALLSAEAKKAERQTAVREQMRTQIEDCLIGDVFED